jgi:TRAP-type C4-dicarboxylate transport system permease small subunit
MRRLLDRFDRAIARVDTPLAGACLLAAVALNVALVIGRFAFNYSANAMEELSVYAVIWMVFLGTLVTDRQGSHINIDLVYHFVRPETRNVLRRIANLLQGVVCVALAGLTLKTVLFTYRIGEVSLSTLAAPVWVLMAVMPPTFLVLAIRGFARAFGAASLSARAGSDSHV